jgi:hypothetical protein
MNLKTLAFACVEMSGAAWLMRPFLEGRGAILVLHTVRPSVPIDASAKSGHLMSWTSFTVAWRTKRNGLR